MPAGTPASPATIDVTSRRGVPATGNCVAPQDEWPRGSRLAGSSEGRRQPGPSDVCGKLQRTLNQPPPLLVPALDKHAIEHERRLSP
jgi:hypothetical protein